MIDASTLKAYRQNRAAGAPAASALRAVKCEAEYRADVAAELEPQDRWGCGPEDGWVAADDGWEYRLIVAPDDWPPQEDWLRPPDVSEISGYLRQTGVSRGVADFEARRLVADQPSPTESWWVIIAEARDPWGRVGGASLGGVCESDADDLSRAAFEHGLFDEARSEAQRQSTVAI